MKTFNPLCTAWQQQVKSFFQGLHGHQSKTLALFVLGAIRAESIVLPRVAEALLEDCDAKVSSIERRLERFLSNKRIETENVWKSFLDVIMPHFQNKPVQLVIDLTSYEEHAQVIYIGIVQHSRVLPLVWKVMPGQTKWEEGLWDTIDELFMRLEPYLKETDCTILGDCAFGCHPMIMLCKKYHWHYLFRICEQHTCERWSRGHLLPTCPVPELVSEVGKKFYGPIRLWQEDQIETNLSAHWEIGYEKPLLVISDRPACRRRIGEYKERFKVESTFQDMKSRGWNWEGSHVRRLDRVDRLLLVLFLLLWWLAHLAGSCIHNGRRDRYDRHDRRDKNIFRLGRLYLLDIERRSRRNGRRGNLEQCLLLQGKPGEYFFSFLFK
ncbi:transposase [Dictyobacter arantiisoli]|uniref:transposase n=1 Tax=Dictyobacter arantiisoli TaxID=2014874 RepID=UPI0011EDD017|nr:transposase [Dictyobacter arantiisoli]